MELYELSAKEIANGVKEGRFGAEEIVRACIERMERYEKYINACITTTPDDALKQARELDARIKREEPTGSLAGVPYFAKDNFCTKGIRTTCGSKMLADWVPTYNATAIDSMKLRKL